MTELDMSSGSHDSGPEDSSAPDLDLRESGDDPTDIPLHPALENTRTASFRVVPGVEIATVFEAEPNRPVTLYDREGRRLVSVTADAFGQAHFAYIPAEHRVIDPTRPLPAELAQEAITLPPGDGYLIRDDTTNPASASDVFRVLGVGDVPAPDLYEAQDIDGIVYGVLGVAEGTDPQDGLHYLTMRDGVKLSAMVRFPDPAIWGEGPYPTVVEYSGYSPSSPESPSDASRIATLLGYASVGVNMRGTGCSGGVFDVFSPAQHADGYDLVEIIARQPWVKGQKVGLVGLSYPGISQLYVAYTRPPGLAAISPMSVIADSWQQLRPGGIYNDGFTRQWLERRDAEAAPNGQSWTDTRIAWGDTVCASHQRLRHQNMKFEELFKALEFFTPSAAARSLPRLVSDIDVPVYLSGGFQDEQTGPQFCNMLSLFSNAALRRFVLYNGRHPDGFSPPMLTRWWEFLELYVAKRVPRMPQWIRDLGSAEFSREFDSSGLTFETDRFASFAEDDYAGVLAAYESEPEVRVLFEMGGDTSQPGAPTPRFASNFDAWPPPAATHRTFFAGADGQLLEAPSEGQGKDLWNEDLDAGQKTFFGPRGYELMARLWDFDWSRFDDGRLLTYVSAPLESPLVLAGPGFAELWIESDIEDVEVQISLMEVRTDGLEVLITSGWHRLGHRQIDAMASSGNFLSYTFTREHFVPLSPGERIQTKIPLPSAGHVLRIGSRLKMVVSSPGRDHGTWEFERPKRSAGGRQRLAWGGSTPSALHLTTLDTSELDDAIPESLPACPGLRGQPCRLYQPAANLRGD